MTPEDTDLKEDFETSFYHFVKSLQVLSHDPMVQCREMGDHNTPWEIQRNAADGGLGTLRLSGLYLKWDQTERIVDLVAELRRLPKEAIVPPHMTTVDHAGSFTAMNHPAWAPLRLEAAQLLQLLAPAIAKNEAYFRNQ